MRELIARFLTLLDQPPPADDEMMGQLAHILDALTHAMGDLPEGRPDTDAPDPPVTNQVMLRRKVCELFPDLGSYPMVDPLTDPSKERPEILVADAIGDLVDIASDLAQAEWRFSHTDASDACWHLHFFYRRHWGRHLLNLRSLIHARLHEQT